MSSAPVSRGQPGEDLIPDAAGERRGHGSAARERLYYPQLDALRFFAFLSVFVFHGLNVRGIGLLARWPMLRAAVLVAHQMLSFGLPLFFFLSAYLITLLLVAEKQRTGGIALPKFYVRRILRIWPLYITFLLAMFVLGRWWEPASFSFGRLAAFLLLGGNWFCIRYGLATAVIGPLWSISVEEQFYAVWPWLTRALPSRRLGWVCLGLGAVALVAIWTLAFFQVTVEQIWFNSLAQSLFLAGGGLMALFAGTRAPARSGRTAAALIAVGLGCWFAASGMIKVDVHLALAPGPTTLCYAFTALGCSAILRGFLALPAHLLSNMLLYLGRISYGLYVFHMAALSVVSLWVGPLFHRLHLRPALLLVALLVDVGLAALSYRLLEKPFLRLKNRFEVVPTGSLL